MTKGKSAGASNYRRGAAAEQQHIHELKDRKREPATTNEKPIKEGPYQRIMRKIDEGNRKKKQREEP